MQKGYSFEEQKSGGSTQQMYRFCSFCEWCVLLYGFMPRAATDSSAHGICLSEQSDLRRVIGITAPGRPDSCSAASVPPRQTFCRFT